MLGIFLPFFFYRSFFSSPPRPSHSPPTRSNTTTPLLPIRSTPRQPILCREAVFPLAFSLTVLASTLVWSAMPQEVLDTLALGILFLGFRSSLIPEKFHILPKSIVFLPSVASWVFFWLSDGHFWEILALNFLLFYYLPRDNSRSYPLWAGLAFLTGGLVLHFLAPPWGMPQTGTFRSLPFGGFIGLILFPFYLRNLYLSKTRFNPAWVAFCTAHLSLYALTYLFLVPIFSLFLVFSSLPIPGRIGNIDNKE